MKDKKKKAIFICQITEGILKVIKCLSSNYSKREFVGLEIEPIPSDIDDKRLAGRLNYIFKKLEYNRDPVIVSLPRNHATCRYLKVPSQIPREIERIANLQASRYLPYPAEELITGYQIIHTDREGNSDVNLVIAHKDIIERYLGIFKELKTPNPTIVLSSYGICNLYHYINPAERASVMVIDIDSQQIELAIISQNKLLFSRSFKIAGSQPNWENLFIDEINKTRDAYLKEVSKEPPSKIIILGANKISQEVFAEVLNKQMDLPAQVLSYNEKINLSDNLLNSLLNSDNSFVSLIGLGLRDIEESINLLPQDIKEKARGFSRRKEYLRVFLLISGIILIWAGVIAKNLDNKTKYLKQLKIELDKVAKEAAPLEEIEKRFKAMESQTLKKPSSLDILYELHQVMPEQISLINFSYEEGEQVILSGQTPQLNSVFAFVLQLEKSAIFKNFSIKVRYATKKKTQVGEIVDFEIVCSKK